VPGKFYRIFFESFSFYNLVLAKNTNQKQKDVHPFDTPLRDDKILSKNQAQNAH